MAKYVLAKDLPFAIAGEIITIKKTAERDSGWNFWDKTLYMSDNYFAVLISGGWIEEVKPREFSLVISRTNGCVYGAAVPHSTVSGDLETIKVREILE